MQLPLKKAMVIHAIVVANEIASLNELKCVILSSHLIYMCVSVCVYTYIYTLLY